LTLAVVAALAVPVDARATEVAHEPAPLGVFFRRPRFILLLVVAAFHEIGLAPYDTLFAAHLTRLAGATVAGVSVALGTTSELAFMTLGAGLVARYGPARLLVVATGTSIVRWTIIALVTNPIVLVAAQSLHAFGFGAFYLSAVALVDEETPPSLRASGQGIFGAACFGVAGALALSLAGFVLERAGMQAVFGAGAIGSVIATACALVLVRVGRKPV
jgi:PPP family 3-phenylpropionic acid transporter